MKIIQIQVVSVPNVIETQCNAFLYALTDTGEIYFRRDNDDKWKKEPDFTFKQQPNSEKKIETTQPIDENVKNPEPKKVDTTFRIGEVIDLKGGKFRIKSFGRSAMILEAVGKTKMKRRKDLEHK